MSETVENCQHNCSECGSECAARTQPQSFLESPNKLSHIKKVIGVMSGKGGVGKSLVTSLLAAAMQKKGFRAAILDADITGPSIPQIFGVREKAYGVEQGIIPAKTSGGIQLMSINLMLEKDTDPVVWRGPVIAGVVRQFWTDVIWEDVDYMFVDMPPGTGDVPLTVFQSLPVDGIVVVSTPQELVGMIVGKAVKMAEMLQIPVLGLVENMAWFECPSCREKHRIFGDSHMDKLAREYGIPALAQIPVNPDLAAACDGGRIEDFRCDWLEGLAETIEKS